MALPACSKAAMQVVRHITVPLWCSRTAWGGSGAGYDTRVGIDQGTTDRYSSRADVMCGAERLLLAPHPPHETTLTAQSQQTGGRPKRARLGAASAANAERRPRASRHEMCLNEQARNPTGHTNRHGPRGNIYECCQPTTPPCEPVGGGYAHRPCPPAQALASPLTADFGVPMA